MNWTRWRRNIKQLNLGGFKVAAKKQILQEVEGTYTKPVVTNKHNT